MADKTENSTNAKRFIDAYNRTDKALHARFGLKPSMSFTDAVRRAASLSTVVRRFEDDLVDYGRLRNAIVHNSDLSQAIAEPHDDVTARFEHIADILETPPMASGIAHRAATVTRNARLSDAVKKMSERDYSNMPVLDNGGVVGVLTNKDIVKFTAAHFGALDAAFSAATVGDAATDGNIYYAVMPDCTVDEILQAFEKNRRMLMIILTDNGKSSGNITGVVTTGDIAVISKMLDTY